MNKTLLNRPGWGVAMAASYGTLLLLKGASEAGVGEAASHITLLNNRTGSALLRVKKKKSKSGVEWETQAWTLALPDCAGKGVLPEIPCSGFTL
jgi:hypothetical protein